VTTIFALASCKEKSSGPSATDEAAQKDHFEAISKDVAKGDATLALVSVGANQQVGFRFEGCRNDGTITLPIANPINSGYICPEVFAAPPNQATYTSGELGKGWNELDLVPHRLTATIGANGTDATYQVGIAADRVTNGGFNGYDIIEAPVLNTAFSDASCLVPVASP
jgi:hypothetical protein